MNNSESLTTTKLSRREFLKLSIEICRLPTTW